jgi:hypothetical protein
LNFILLDNLDYYQKMASQVPLFYRIWLTIVAPLHLSMATILNTYYHPAPNPLATHLTIALESFAFFLMSIGFLQVAFTSRKPKNMVVWRTLQAATFLMDLFTLSIYLRRLNTRKETDWTTWMISESVELLFTTSLAIIRTLFFAGRWDKTSVVGEDVLKSDEAARKKNGGEALTTH